MSKPVILAENQRRKLKVLQYSLVISTTSVLHCLIFQTWYFLPSCQDLVVRKDLISQFVNKLIEAQIHLETDDDIITMTTITVGM